MNEIELKSFPFDSIVDDREYEASIFRNYFGKFLTTGVYFGLYNNYGDYSMKVMADTGLNIKIRKGCGLINGADFNLEDDITLALQMPIGSNRKDMVVVRLDDTLEQRRTKMYIKQGTDTDFAQLERTIDVYEICLAQIIVQDRALEVTIDDITDTRRNKELCGIVTSLIDIDIQDVLDDINLKKDTFFAQLNITTKEDIDNFIEDLSNYCETVKHTLDGDVAVNLVNLIDTTKTSLLNLINTKANKKKLYNIEIDTEWIEGTGNIPIYTKTITIDGILETDIVNVYPVWSNDIETRETEMEEYSKISVVKSQANAIELVCDYDKPEVALNVRIEVTY